MKKNKILTSLSIFLLIFSFSGCSVVENDSSSMGDEMGSNKADDRNPVSDLFEQVKENNNYTLLIDYYSITSSKFSSLDDLYDYYIYTLEEQDLWVEITYTNQAMLIEYYASISDYLLGLPVDTELFVNTNDGLQVYQVYDYYSTDLVNTSTKADYTWQTYSYSLLNLLNFASYFERGDIIESGDGEVISYNITGLSNYYFMQSLIYSMFYAGNYFGYDLGGPNNILSLVAAGYSSDIAYASYYYVDYDEWITTLDSGTQIWYDSSYQYWVEYDVMQASIYNVGESKIPSIYQGFLS